MVGRSSGAQSRPGWVLEPDLVGWLIGRLTPQGLRSYFQELELIAKQTCDLELLRLARRYQGQAATPRKA